MLTRAAFDGHVKPVAFRRSTTGERRNRPGRGSWRGHGRRSPGTDETSRVAGEAMELGGREKARSRRAFSIDTLGGVF
jgi:hypothetical protein